MNEATLITMTGWMADLLAEIAVARRLVLSMALAIPAERLPDDERTLLDEVLEND